MRQLKGKPKENAKEKKERKKEFAENREKAFSVGDYYLFQHPNSSSTVNTLNIFSSPHPGRLFRATCDARLLGHKTKNDPYGRNVNSIVWWKIMGDDVCYKVLSKETPFFLPLIEMFWLKQPSLSTMPPFVCAYCYCLHFYTAVIYYLLEKLYLYFCQ